MPPFPTSRIFGSFAGSAAGSGTAAARASASRLVADVRDINARSKFTAGNDHDWQVTDLFHRAEEEPSVVFSDEAIDETARQMIGQAYSVEEPDESHGADAAMEAAQARMTRNTIQELMPVIRDMMRDPDIQRAAVSHLRRSPHFQQYLLADATSGAAVAPLALEWNPTGPSTDPQGVDAGLPGLIEELGAKMMAAGEAAMSSAVGFRNAVARLLIHLGANLHAFLGRPFSKTPLEEDMSEEQLNERAEFVGQALTTVAIAILSIVLLKRVHIVTAL